jgi:hypothetical protein
MPMRRRPLAMVARTAVVAGTATAVSGRVARRQEARFDQQEQEQAQASPPQPVYQQPVYQPPSAGGDDDVSALRQMAELHEQGILTDDEFAAKKAQILGLQ